MDKRRIIVGFSTAMLLLVCYAKLFAGQKPKRKRIQKKEPVSSSFWAKSKPKITEDDIWNTAIFFPDYFPEKEYSKTRQLIWYLEQAEFTVDVCMYGFAFRMIEDVLIKLSKEDGVKIRILSNQPIPRHRLMNKAEIETRTKKHLWTSYFDRTTYIDLMHHKFVVIDSWAAMAGSLNWTMPGITENFENVVITTAPRIVTKYVGEFERLWEESDPKPKPLKMQPC